MALMRRTLLIGFGAAAVTGTGGSQAEERAMYGLIGKMLATPGQRDGLARIMLEEIRPMAGCLSYLIAKDPTNPDAIWITEVWDSAERHKASLQLPSVQATIAKARPIIAGFGERFETEPVGGLGLTADSNISDNIP